MKRSYIFGLIVTLICSTAGFSQNPVQNPPQNQNQPQQVQQQQAKPQQTQPQNQPQQAQPQNQPQTQVRNQSQAPPQTQNRSQPQVQQTPGQVPQRPQATQNQPQSQSPNQPAQAPNTPDRRAPRQRPSDRTQQPVDKSSVLTERAKIQNERQSKAPEHIVWLREMYRNIDLDKDNNAALYYPVQPIGDRMNLFTTIFKLMADNKITAYNYVMDRQEVFTDSEKVNFESILKKFQILYKKEGTGENVRYIVDNSDIPSSEVLTYTIKEGWYFDAATGMFKSQVLAICPLLVRQDYSVGDITNNALFWIPYENLRPYLARTPIMTSNYNNVMNYSIDDFFTKGMYKGDIIKTVNLKDQSLVQQVGNDPEKLKHAQDSIESQLKAFKDQLWVHQDTTQVADTKSGKKASVKKGSGSTKTSVKNESASKEQKPKAVKAEKSSASPARSVRRTR